MSTWTWPNSFSILAFSAGVWWCRLSPQPAARTAIKRSGVRRFKARRYRSLRRARACLGWRVSARLHLVADDADARRAPRRELARLDGQAPRHFLVAERVLVLARRGDVAACDVHQALLIGVAGAHRPVRDFPVELRELGVHLGPLGLGLLVPAATRRQEQEQSYDPHVPHRQERAISHAGTARHSRGRLGSDSAILSWTRT